VSKCISMQRVLYCIIVALVLSDVQYTTVQYSTVQYSSVLYSTMQ